jgi:hypothetical protein
MASTGRIYSVLRTGERLPRLLRTTTAPRAEASKAGDKP